MNFGTQNFANTGIIFTVNILENKFKFIFKSVTQDYWTIVTHATKQRSKIQMFLIILNFISKNFKILLLF